MAQKVQIFSTALGLLITITLTALGIYAAVKANELYLPIPTLPTVFAIIVPILGFLAFIFHSRPAGKRFILRFLSPSAGLAILSLLDASLITIASTRLETEFLECSTDNRWDTLWRAKNVLAIKGIQQALECCGLHSPLDRAWPFPDRAHGADACLQEYGRGLSCGGPWKHQGRVVLGIWLAIGISGLVTKAIFVIVQRGAPQELIREHLRQPNLLTQARIAEDESEDGRYRDQPAEPTSLDGAVPTARRENN